ncbi:MAG: type I 3-dehydroquinate dehydratase [Promethearchaeota archaeon]
MHPNICIPIPINTSQLDENITSIRKILAENPEFIEFRFDFIDNVEELTSEFISKLIKSINTDVSTIFTFRDYSEGGHNQISIDKHSSLMKSLIEAQPDYIDIELRSNIMLLNQIINYAIINRVKIIFSYHNLETTPPYQEALNLINSLKNKIINECSPNLNDLQDIIYKFIFTAQTFEDNLVVLNLCKYFREKNQKIISFCMGELGIFSRIVCTLTGSFLTFASLEKTTAPGQLNIKKMKEFYRLISINL